MSKKSSMTQLYTFGVKRCYVFAAFRVRKQTAYSVYPPIVQSASVFLVMFMS
jgi:hypothetical protein